MKKKNLTLKSNRQTPTIVICSAFLLHTRNVLKTIRCNLHTDNLLSKIPYGGLVFIFSSYLIICLDFDSYNIRFKSENKYNFY